MRYLWLCLTEHVAQFAVVARSRVVGCEDERIDALLVDKKGDNDADVSASTREQSRDEREIYKSGSVASRIEEAQNDQDIVDFRVMTASLRAGDDPGAARLHHSLPDRRRDGRRAGVARLQARPVVHARENPRLVDSDHPDVRRHRGDHSLDLPAGRLRVVPVVLSSSCLLLPVVVPLSLPMSRLIKSFVELQASLSIPYPLPIPIPYHQLSKHSETP